MPPDKDGFPTPDEIINGASLPPKRVRKSSKVVPKAEIPQAQVKRVQLDDDQMKAISFIASGGTFVFVGIKQTSETGADFYTALGGNKEDLRNAKDHLEGVVDRLYKRKGIV